MPAPLDETIRNAAAGDRTAIETLLLHFHDPLLKFIKHSLASCPGISEEDVLQETMIAAFRGVSTLKPLGPEAFLRWLKTIARTRLLNLIEAAKAQKRGGGRKPVAGKFNADSTATSVLGIIVGPDRTPSLIARRHEAVDIVAKALAKLDPERRRIIDLRYGKGLSIQDIAVREGKGEGAIKMLIHRSMKELRDAIKSEFNDFSIGE